MRLGIFAPVPKFEASALNLVNELFEFALPPAFAEYLIVAQENKMIIPHEHPAPTMGI